MSKKTDRNQSLEFSILIKLKFVRFAPSAGKSHNQSKEEKKDAEEYVSKKMREK